MTWKIRDQASFRELRRNGVRARSGAISVTFVPRAGQSPQVAYVISRRVGNAVVRNRLRRRLQAMVSNRIRLAPTTLSSGLYLITPSPAAVSLPSERLAEALSTALDTSQSRASLSGASR